MLPAGRPAQRFDEKGIKVFGEAFSRKLRETLLF